MSGDGPHRWRSDPGNRQAGKKPTYHLVNPLGADETAWKTVPIPVAHAKGQPGEETKKCNRQHPLPVGRGHQRREKRGECCPKHIANKLGDKLRGRRRNLPTCLRWSRILRMWLGSSGERP